MEMLKQTSQHSANAADDKVSELLEQPLSQFISGLLAAAAFAVVLLAVQRIEAAFEQDEAAAQTREMQATGEDKDRLGNPEPARTAP